jgi:hypothetical protein
LVSAQRGAVLAAHCTAKKGGFHCLGGGREQASDCRAGWLLSFAGAHLLRITDPSTGRRVSDDRILPHIGMFFFAGHDTTGHTIGWTLCDASCGCPHARA